jgi:hypothetical protein
MKASTDMNSNILSGAISAQYQSFGKRSHTSLVDRAFADWDGLPDGFRERGA